MTPVCITICYIEKLHRKRLLWVCTQSIQQIWWQSLTSTGHHWRRRMQNAISLKAHDVRQNIAALAHLFSMHESGWPSSSAFDDRDYRVNACCCCCCQQKSTTFRCRLAARQATWFTRPSNRLPPVSLPLRAHSRSQPTSMLSSRLRIAFH